MKTRSVVGIVALAHVLAVGCVLLTQGCGTFGGKKEIAAPPAPKMPPTETVGSRKADPTGLATGRAPTVREWPDETTTHVVAKGECLSVIARRHGLSSAELAALNGIKDKDFIRIGQKLIIPAGPGRAPRPSPAPVDGDVYVVRSGDCLSVIAVKTGTTVDTLMEANNLSSDEIRVGQKLVIPEGAAGTGSPSSPTARSGSGDAPPVPDVPAVDGSADLTPALRVAPPAPPARPSPPAPDTAARSGAGSYRIHVVEKGEDLYSVALMWAVSVEDLKRLNGIAATALEEGMRLKIPMAD